MVMKPEQFTEQAQAVLRNSQELVNQYHHTQWDVEHILHIIGLADGVGG